MATFIRTLQKAGVKCWYRRLLRDLGFGTIIGEVTQIHKGGDMRFSCSKLLNSVGLGVYVVYHNGTPSVVDPAGLRHPGVTIGISLIKWVVRLDTGRSDAL